MQSLAESAHFINVVGLTDDQRDKQRHLEYASRFLTHTFLDYDGKLDVEEFIDESLKTLANAGEQAKTKRVFLGTFKLLNDVFADDALRRRQPNGSHGGRIGLAAFEAIAVGIGRNYAAISKLPDPQGYVKTRVVAFWKSAKIGKFFTPGMRGTIRIDRTVPFGRDWFRP